MTEASTPRADEDAAETTVLDNRRIPCAVGLIRAQDAAAHLAPGSVLEIHTRDRFAPVEIALWAKLAGHSEPDIRRAGHWPYRYRVFSLVVGGAETAG